MRRTLVTLALIACLGALLAADDPKNDSRAAFTDGSLWVGIARPVHHPNRRPEARLRVTKRDGDAFEADYHIKTDDDSRGLTLRGRIDAKGNITAQPVRILGGEWKDDNLLNQTWTGSIDGRIVRLTYPNKTETVESELTLQRGKGKKRRK